MASPSTRSLAILLVTGLVPTVVLAQPLVVIDAGHGGTDPGASACSLEEASVVLDVAQRLQVLLEAAGVRIAMTRTDDTFVGLSERAAYANARGADAFVSVHSNANAGAPATGTETFIYPGAGARTRALGQGIQDAMIAAWMLRDRGLKDGNFAVLRETSMPAALGELAFTNNCALDATLLADPTARQRLAEHERDAILEWLGIDPSMREGTMRGFVFEDQGVGLEDVTVRIEGASVRIVETGTSAIAAADGAFSFAVGAGTYTIEASHAGHAIGSRACTVIGGIAVDCPIGLFPSAAADAGALEDGSVGGAGDAGASEDASAGDAGAASVLDEDGSVAADVGSASRGRREPVGCGCRAAGAAPGASGWIAIALALLIAARRRAASVLAVAVSLGCAASAGRIEPPLLERPISITLGEEREWLAREYTDPVLSPDGRHVAIASADHGALFVATLDGELAFREVCRIGRCGFAPRWQGDRVLAFRLAGQTGTAIPAAAITIDTMARAEPIGSGGVHAWTDDDDRAWLRIEGQARVISPEGARVIQPVIAGGNVVMWDLENGILVHRIADGSMQRLGPGGHPRVDPSGRWLVFERVEDDGHALTRGDLAICDLDDGTLAPLIETSDRIERAPTLSAIDARGRGRLAYLAEGALIVRTIEVHR